MTEGGLFAWKLQTIQSRGPAGTYKDLHRPLPPPPKDMHWTQDLDTNEWHLAKIVDDVDGVTDESLIKEATVEVDESPDFVDHAIKPTDTFQGICLKYKVTPTELRRANGGFSGTNLHLVPNPLRIPLNQKYKQQQQQQPLQATTPAQKIRRLQLAIPGLATTEAKAYLELNDWSLEKAMENAREDGFGA